MIAPSPFSPRTHARLYLILFSLRAALGESPRWSEPDSRVCSGGRRKSWRREDRDEGRLTPDCAPAVTSGRTGESPETWIDFFEWERTKFQISVDLSWWNVSRAGQRERLKMDSKCHFRKRRAVLFFKKTATGQLLLRALLSLPSECKLLNSAANE